MEAKHTPQHTATLELDGVLERAITYAGDYTESDRQAAELWALLCEYKESPDYRGIVHAANLYPELVAALELAQELTTTARQYFPKSMHNGDKFSLETTCAAIGTALAKCGEE